MTTELYAVILAGGSGTRFWPASRKARPKQFLAITGERTMLAETYARVAELIPIERTLVVCGASQVELVRESLPDLPAANILAEPVGRNTLPAVALAAYEIERRGGASLQLVLPADHVIAPWSSFHASVRAACEVAQQSGALVTFGIQPTHPATGYGYIEVGQSTHELAGWNEGDGRVHEVARFVEKPDEAKAREFLASGRFLWNSGMFLWTSAAITAALAEHAPDVHEQLRSATSETWPGIYPELPSLPIDTGVMEKAGHRRVLPIDYTWSDVGSWSALPEVVEPSEDEHYVVGPAEVVSHDSQGCVVHTGEQRELIALVGLKNMVVVRSEGATLVCPRERSQDVRAIVDALKKRDSDQL